EDDRGVQRFRRRLVGAARPDDTEFAGETLRRRIAGAGEGIDVAALPARHLGNDVRRRAEAVEAETPPLPRPAQRAVADQAGAEQRCRLDIAVTRLDGETEALVGDGVLTVAAIDLVAGKTCLFTQVFAAGTAERTDAAGPTQPGNTD